MTSGSVDGENIPILADHPIKMTFEGDRVGGTASCNSYGGSFQLSGSEISFDDLAMTEMACSPEETMQAEAMFAEALTRVDSVSIDGALTLSGPGVEMEFEALEPVPESDLTNTVWVLDGLVQGDSVSTPAMDSRATVEFFTDGSMLGDTGCRPFSGRYVISGAEVTVTELAADGNECEPDMADQDSHFLTAIGDSFRVEIDQTRLTTWSQGNVVLVFRAGS